MASNNDDASALNLATSTPLGTDTAHHHLVQIAQALSPITKQPASLPIEALVNEILSLLIF